MGASVVGRNIAEQYRTDVDNRQDVVVKPALRNWLMQRLSAVLLAAYAAIMPLYVWRTLAPGASGWHQLFMSAPVRLATLAFVLALALHAWLGMNEILLDYIKSPRLQVVLQALVVIWLLACVLFMIVILWGRQ